MNQMENELLTEVFKKYIMKTKTFSCKLSKDILRIKDEMHFHFSFKHIIWKKKYLEKNRYFDILEHYICTMYFNSFQYPIVTCGL